MIAQDFNKYIRAASKADYIIPGFNVFGYDYAVGVIKAAEKMNTPALVMINKLAVNYMDIVLWGKMLRYLAKQAAVPIGVHLDHTSNIETIKKAIDSGFTSVMYDGSQLPLEKNIENTQIVSEIAKRNNVLLEAEIGSVPYNDMPGSIKDELTTAAQGDKFAKESGCDWMAVAVGNIHRLTDSFAPIDFNRLKSIEKLVDIPLVVHGATGISRQDMQRLTKTKVGKVNIGTSLRKAFVSSLQAEINDNPNQLDSIKLFSKPTEQVTKAAMEKIVMLNSINKYDKS